jgi:nucleoside-diphosphate-sugar epimerase
MRILCTGGFGYIGRVLIEELRKDKTNDVVVMDTCIYNNEVPPEYTHWFKDVRHVRSLKNFDVVLHLAALLGGQVCEKHKREAWDINHGGTKNLVDIAIRDNVKKFVFCSTCSNYGKSDSWVNEDSPLMPLKTYAESKIQAEQEVKRHPNHTILRFATCFGVSPRMRMDLMINEWVGDAMRKGVIEVYSPDAWRPNIHIRDAVRAIIQCMKYEAAENKTFNVGADWLNRTKGQLAREIEQFIPNTRVKYVEKEDVRDYRVRFNKIKDELDFIPRFSIMDGIAEVKKFVEQGEHDWDKYYNERAIKEIS